LRKSLKGNVKTTRSSSSDPALTALLEDFFFDWFQVTLPNKEGKASCEVGSPEETHAIDMAFRWCASESLHPGRVGGGHNGYRAGMPFTPNAQSKEVVARINSGSTSGIMPNIMLTGGHGACEHLAPSLQAAFPGARLSRADAALDTSQEGLWDALLAMAKLLSKGNTKMGGVRTIESDTGRTFYLGSRTSTVSLRVYEKDLERAAKGVISIDDVDPDLIRIEWTFRPQSKSKAGMAGLSPAEMIRTSVWARKFMSQVAKIMTVTDRAERIYKQDVEREVVEKTLEGAVQHGIDQYARSFTRLAAARIVDREYAGHYDTAMVDPDDVEAEAVLIFGELLRQTDAAARVVAEERLDVSLDPDAWRSSYVAEMLAEPQRQCRGQILAQERLILRLDAVGMGGGS
jgi:hypothetical protein